MTFKIVEKASGNCAFVKANNHHQAMVSLLQMAKLGAGITEDKKFYFWRGEIVKYPGIGYEFRTVEGRTYRVTEDHF